METAAKEDVELKSTVHGGDRDVYGEDTASEDQPVTPWCVSVARCVQRGVVCFTYKDTNNIVIGIIVVYMCSCNYDFDDLYACVSFLFYGCHIIN